MRIEEELDMRRFRTIGFHCKSRLQVLQNKGILMEKKSSVILYVALVGIFSLPWYALMIHTKNLGMDRGFVVHTLMWCPALAALVTCYLSGISVSSLGFRWPKIRYIGLGYGLPILYALLAYVPFWIAT